MEKSSNEPKNKRQRHEAVKATLKVVLKRYFLVPSLLYLFNMIGSMVAPVIFNLEGEEMYGKSCIYTIVTNITWGFIAIFIFCVSLILLIELFGELISYQKERTLIQDIQGLWYELPDTIVWIAKNTIKLPKRIYNRIREEPERFKEAVKEQEMKQKKENNEIA